jgi:hypothetical protein
MMIIRTLTSRAATIVTAFVVASAFMVTASWAGTAASAQAAPPQAARIASVAAAAPCAGQGSCQYCGSGGIGTGGCTLADLEFNVAWCGQNRAHLSSYNKAKCSAEASYLPYAAHPDQILPWISIICLPSNARTVYLVVKGIVRESGWVTVACAGIGVYTGFQALVFKLL